MREFQGWTPETIENLTYDQLNAILKILDDHRSKVSSVEVSMAELRNAIFAWLGIKRKNIHTSENLPEKLKDSPLPLVQMTKEEKEEYFNAGMPGPPDEWLVKRRKVKNANR